MNKEELYEVVAEPDISIIEAMKRMDITGYGILFIVQNEKLVGTLTDGDIRRWLIQTGDLKSCVTSVMNSNPIYIEDLNRAKAIDFMREKRLKAVPIVDKKGALIDVVFNSLNSNIEKKDKNALAGVSVVIMAGGKGTRLYPYTKVLPKPLIPIGDVPILDRITDLYNEYGASDFYLIVNHMKNMIKAYISEAGHPYNISFVDENEPLGTGGGIKLLEGKINNTFVLSNCDTLIDDDYGKIIDFHRREKNDVTMICALKSVTIPYGVIKIGDNGSIKGMEEKPDLTYFTNTGCYIVEPHVMDVIKQGETIGFPSVISRVEEKGGKVKAYPISEQAWMDMGQFDSMEEMIQNLNKRKKL